MGASPKQRNYNLLFFPHARGVLNITQTETFSELVLQWMIRYLLQCRGAEDADM